MRRGISVSPGVAVGTAFCIHEIFVNPARMHVGEADTAAELARYEEAREQAKRALSTLTSAIGNHAGRDAAAIFAAQGAVLRDLALADKVRAWILDEQISAQAALQRLLELYKTVFSRVEDAYVPIGLMVEAPAAAITIRSMLPQVDFVSIGSNDLVQYLMAADRDNPKVAHLCQPLALAVIQVLTDVVHKCNAVGRTVTACGEMAGQSRAFVLLLAMGVRSFSMSPAFIPLIKEFAKHLSIADAVRILQHALTLHTTGKVTRYLAEQMKRLSPDFDRFDFA